MKAVPVIVLAILAGGILIFFGWIGYSAYQQRQGPDLNSTTPPIFKTKTPLPAKPTAIPVTPTLASEVSATPTEQLAVITAEPTVDACGEDGVWNILILGSDYGELRGQKGSDLTRVLQADFTNKKVVIYSFSRDLWVDTSGLGFTNPPMDSSTLGLVFYEGRLRSLQFAESDTIVDGTRATAGMLWQNFSINTDHYMTLDLAHLAGMIDAIGGLPINVPSRTTDPWIGVVIEAGQQTLTGAQVVAYARAIPDNDFGRIQRNNLILDALRQQMITSDIISRLPDLFTQFKEAIITDMSFEQINHLACLLKETPSGSIIQESVKQEWTSPGPSGSLLWNRDFVLSSLKNLGLIK